MSEPRPYAALSLLYAAACSGDLTVAQHEAVYVAAHVLRQYLQNTQISVNPLVSPSEAEETEMQLELGLMFPAGKPDPRKLN